MDGLFEYWAILKAHFKMQMGVSAAKALYRNNRKQFNRGILLGVVVLFGFSVFLVPYSIFLNNVMRVAALNNLGDVVLAMGLIIVLSTMLFTGTLSLLANIINSQDVEYYAPRPVRASSVFFAKFTLSYIGEMWFCMFFLIPLVIVYFIYNHTTILYWPITILVLLIAPLMPLCISGILSLPLSSLAIKSKYKEIVAAAIGIIIFALIFGGQSLLQGVGMRDLMRNEDTVQNILGDTAPFIRVITSLFPPAMWALNAITGSITSALLGLFTIVGVVLVALAIVGILAEKSYMKIALSILEISKGKHWKKLDKPQKMDSIFLTILKKEWRIILRSSTYLLNTMSGALIFPVLLVLYPNMRDIITSGGLLPQIFPDGIGERYTFLVFAIIAIGLSFIGVMNLAAATIISREGRRFWIMQTVPVDPKTQLRGKLICSLSITYLEVIIAGTSLFLFLRPPAHIFILGLAASLVMSVAVTAANMIPDMIKPKMNWDSESEAIKQNMNVIYGIFLALFQVVAFLGIAVLFYFARIELVLGAISLTIIAAIFGVALVWFIEKLYIKRYREI